MLRVEIPLETHTTDHIKSESHCSSPESLIESYEFRIKNIFLPDYSVLSQNKYNWLHYLVIESFHNHTLISNAHNRNSPTCRTIVFISLMNHPFFQP